MDASVETACSNYLRYVELIFEPATKAFIKRLDEGCVQLHEVFGANLFVAHAVDYIRAIRAADEISESRATLVRNFDKHFSVEGARFQNRKFELIDAVNNALKHIELDKTRYPELVNAYGNISFSSLIQADNRVVCILEGYRFDYSRVVLRPAISALSNWDFEDLDHVLEFARGDIKIEGVISSLDWEDPIDQMIAYANPVCDDCGESSDLCACETYTYNGKAGTFTSNFCQSFDFDSVMSRISGAYRSDR